MDNIWRFNYHHKRRSYLDNIDCNKSVTIIYISLDIFYPLGAEKLGWIFVWQGKNDTRIRDREGKSSSSEVN